MAKDGQIYLVPCPAAQALDPTMDPSELELFANAASAAAGLANTSATNAATSESNAAASAADALASKNAAASSATSANSSKNAAATSASTASTKAGEASSSASSAATFKSGADTAKSAAETARNKAQDWADKAEDSPVETGRFSARHWALKAAASAAALGNLAWSAISGKPSITAGNGLTGGGLLDTSKTLTLGTPGTLSGSTTNSVSTSSHTHALSTNLSAWDGKHPNNFMEMDGVYGTLVEDYDAVVNTGLYRGNTSVVGAPINYTTMLHISRGGGRASQLAFTAAYTTNRLYFRNQHDTWNNWTELWHSDNFDPTTKASTGISISAGNGLSGGGTLAASRTITLGTPGTLSGSTTNAVQSTSHTHALSANLSAWDGYHPNNAWVDKGAIPGSQNLNNYTTTGVYHQNANADATSGTNYPSNVAGMLVVYNSSAMTYQTYQAYNSGDVWTRSRYNTSWSAWKLSVDGTTTISAGNGLSGGGTLAANRTISLGTPGTLSGSTTNSVSTSSHTHALSANLSAWDSVATSSKADVANPVFTGAGKISAYEASIDFVSTGANGRTIRLLSNNTPNAGLYDATNNAWLFRIDGNNRVHVAGGEVWHSGTFNPSSYTPTSRSISAGNGLSGGGNFTANRTISLGTPGTLSGSTTNSVSTSSHTHALSSNLSTLDGFTPSVNDLVNSVALRTGSADIYARLFRSTYASQATIPASASMAFRNNDSSDNYIRFVSGGDSVKSWIGLAALSTTSSNQLQITTNYGNSSFGAANTSYCHMNTDSPNFYMNKGLQVNGEIAHYNGPRVPKMFVQSGDPGSSATTGDLWIW